MVYLFNIMWPWLVQSNDNNLNWCYVTRYIYRKASKMWLYIYIHNTTGYTCAIILYDLNTTKTSDAIDLGHSMKTKMAATAVWRLTLYPMQDIACEHDILKTARRIDFTFWYGLNTTKTSDAINLGHSTKTKMAATAIWRLTLYPMQDIASERDILKTACQIDFTFWYGLYTTKTWDAIDFGHSTTTKMPATAVWRLTLYPMQDISCECGSLKSACRIDFTFDKALLPSSECDPM